MVREHTEEMEAGSDDLRKSVLGKIEKVREASVLGQGLKILDKKVENLAFGAWQALGNAGNGLETGVVNTTRVISRKLQDYYSLNMIPQQEVLRLVWILLRGCLNLIIEK